MPSLEVLIYLDAEASRGSKLFLTHHVMEPT